MVMFYIILLRVLPDKQEETFRTINQDLELLRTMDMSPLSRRITSLVDRLASIATSDTQSTAEASEHEPSIGTKSHHPEDAEVGSPKIHDPFAGHRGDFRPKDMIDGLLNPTFTDTFTQLMPLRH